MYRLNRWYRCRLPRAGSIGELVVMNCEYFVITSELVKQIGPPHFGAACNQLIGDSAAGIAEMSTPWTISLAHEV
jgi:hypothetical protein